MIGVDPRPKSIKFGWYVPTAWFLIADFTKELFGNWVSLVMSLVMLDNFFSRCVIRTHTLASTSAIVFPMSISTNIPYKEHQLLFWSVRSNRLVNYRETIVMWLTCEGLFKYKFDLCRLKRLRYMSFIKIYY